MMMLLLAWQLLAAPADVAGWSTLTWGMSLDDVRQRLAIPAEPFPPDPRFQTYAAWTLPEVIAGQPYLAFLYFDREAQRLVSVTLEGHGEVPRRWARLRDLLTDKYGAPTRERGALEWRFPSHAHRPVHGAARRSRLRHLPRDGDDPAGSGQALAAWLGISCARCAKAGASPPLLEEE